VLQICILFSLVLSTANRVVGIIDAIGILGNESVPIQLAQSCWFPGLKHKYAILSVSTRKLLRLEITKILIAVYKKNKFIASFVIIFGTLSRPIAFQTQSERVDTSVVHTYKLRCAFCAALRWAMCCWQRRNATIRAPGTFLGQGPSPLI